MILFIAIGFSVTLCVSLQTSKTVLHQHPSDRLIELTSQARDTKKAVPLLGVHDALSARIFQQQFGEANGGALFVSGFGVSAARLGQPDAGILTRTEMEDAAKNIIQHSGALAPVIVDCDTGFGGTPNVHQTIRQMAAIRAAAITIEDQKFPKRCTYIAGSGVNVIEREDATQRIRAAMAAKKEAWDQDGNKILVVARTDSRMALGYEEAVERCLLFQELGADIVYAENLQSASEYTQLRDKISPSTPMMLAQVKTGDPSQRLWTLDEIGSMGFEMALWGVTGLQAAVVALEQAATEIMAYGGLVESTPLASLDKVKGIVGFSELGAFEEEYGCS